MNHSTTITCEVKLTGTPANMGHDQVVFVFDSDVTGIDRLGPNEAVWRLSRLLAGDLRRSGEFRQAALEMLDDLAFSNVASIGVAERDDEVAAFTST